MILRYLLVKHSSNKDQEKNRLPFLFGDTIQRYFHDERVGDPTEDLLLVSDMFHLPSSALPATVMEIPPFSPVKHEVELATKAGMYLQALIKVSSNHLSVLKKCLWAPGFLLFYFSSEHRR